MYATPLLGTSTAQCCTPLSYAQRTRPCLSVAVRHTVKARAAHPHVELLSGHAAITWTAAFASGELLSVGTFGEMDFGELPSTNAPCGNGSISLLTLRDNYAWRYYNIAGCYQGIWYADQPVGIGLLRTAYAEMPEAQQLRRQGVHLQAVTQPDGRCP